MSYKYKGFIPQQIAPKGTKNIGVYNENGEKVCTIPLGRLTPVTKEKLYSFGLLADVHIQPYNTNTLDNGQTVGAFISAKLENAFHWFEEQGASFVCIPGDFVNRGFVNSSGTFVIDEFGEYKRICDLFPNLPVYVSCGNHESYNEAITERLTELKQYTGADLCYTVEQGNDLFIFVGQPSGSVVMSDDDFQWLSETLEANKDRRCFVFVHSYIEEDSGDAKDLRENSIFDMWGATKTKAFIELLSQYTNVILFHGHSHIKFEYQELDKSANYTDKNGFKSVHIPSLGRPRNIDLTNSETPHVDSEGQGYIVDVYEDCIVLNGMDLVNFEYIPTGVFKIDI